MNEYETLLPHVGQWVDFYLSNNERVAAVVIEVHEFDSINRPKVNLQVFTSDGEINFHEDVKPVDTQGTEEEIELEGQWAFQHEIPLLQKDTHDKEVELGSQTNRHVGTLQSFV